VLRIGGELQSVRMSGGVECDEVYATPRVSREGTTAGAPDGLVVSLERRGRGAWSEDKPPIFIPVERVWSACHRGEV